MNKKEKKLKKIEQAIDFYLTYHKVPEPAKTMIKGNVIIVIKNEFNIP